MSKANPMIGSPKAGGQGQAAGHAALATLSEACEVSGESDHSPGSVTNRSDGSKRRVYRYGPQDNYVGGRYVMPESDIRESGGRQ